MPDAKRPKPKGQRPPAPPAPPPVSAKDVVHQHALLRAKVQEYIKELANPAPDSTMRMLYQADLAKMVGMEDPTVTRRRWHEGSKRNRKQIEPCDHPWHRNPALITPCPKCGAGK